MAKQSEVMEALLKQKKSDFFIKEGELVKGVVLEKLRSQIFIDVGPYGTGIIYGAEFKNTSHIIKNLRPGDIVYGKITTLQNEDGYVELSLKEADEQRGWESAKEAAEKEEAIDVIITGYNRGGLVAQVFGLQAFMPVSHLSLEKYPRVGADQNKILEALRTLVGKTLKVKVITVNQRGEKLIISERAALEESLRGLVAQYKVGDVVEGVVSGVVDFGAFVRFTDNPEIEGLIHLSELDHRLIDHPRSVVRVDDAIQAKIIEIKDSRVSLSLKALKENPWDTVRDRYQEGREIVGEVVKFNPFGALVRLDNDFQGLVHVSEFGGVEAMQKTLAVGEKFPFIIQAIKPEEKRIVLVFPEAEKAKLILSADVLTQESNASIMPPETTPGE